MKKVIDLASALHSLAPGSSWIYEDDDYSTIQWLSEDIDQPSEDSVMAEIARLQKELEEEVAKEEAKMLALESARLSAIEKLSALGLTEEEAKAIIGI
jgi:hypothetical protein